MDKIRVEKIGDDKYVLYFGDEEKIEGYVLTRSQLKLLQSNLTQILDLNETEAGSNIK